MRASCNRFATVIAVATRAAALLGLIVAVFASLSQPADAADAPLVFPIRQGDLHGLIDRTGKVIVPPEFEQPLKLQDGLIMAQKGTKTAFFDAVGNMMIRPQDITRGPFSEGLAPAWIAEGGKPATGYVDKSMTPAIRGEFRDPGPFSDGLADVAVADEWGVFKRGYIDRSGKVVAPPRYEKTFPFANGIGRASITRDSLRLIDKTGRDITPAGIDFVGIQSEGLTRVWTGRKEGYVDTSGKLVIPTRFDQASEFSEGFARVWQTLAPEVRADTAASRALPGGGRYGYIDRSGNVVIEPRFVAAEAFSDGLALVKEAQGAGEAPQVFIDTAGKVVLKPGYDRVYPFTSGRAVFKDGNRYGYLDKSGKVAIPAQYSFARPFSGPLAPVVMGRQSAWIDLDGRVVWRSDEK